MDTSNIPPTTLRTRSNSVSSPKDNDSNDEANPAVGSVDAQIIKKTLRDEGLLLRNKGTNSIRSMTLELEKFNVMFQTMNTSLHKQTMFLGDMLNELYEEHDKQEVRAALAALNNHNRSQPTRNPNPRPTNNNNSSGAGFNLFGLPNLFGPGLLTAAKFATGIAGTMLAKIASDFTIAMAKDFGMSDAMINVFSDSLYLGTMLGALGMGISKKLGLYGLVGGAAFGFADKLLDAAGLDGDKMISLFGAEFKLDTLAGLAMSAASMGLLRTLTKSKLAGLATSMFTGNPLLLLGKSKILGAVGVMAFGAMNLYSEEIAKYISDATGIDFDVANTAIDDISIIGGAASLGAMFGPTGLIIGAAVGFAYVIGKHIYNWLSNSNEAAEAKMKSIGELIDSQENSTDYTMSRSQRKEVKAQLDEAVRTKNEDAANIFRKVYNEDTRRQGMVSTDTSVNNPVYNILEGKEELRDKFISVGDPDQLNTPEMIRSYVDELISQLPEGYLKGNEEILFEQVATALKQIEGVDITGDTPRASKRIMEEIAPQIVPQLIIEQSKFVDQNMPLPLVDGKEPANAPKIREDLSPAVKIMYDVSGPIETILKHHMKNGVLDDASAAFKTDYALNKAIIERQLVDLGLSVEQINSMLPGDVVKALSKKIAHVDTTATTTVVRQTQMASPTIVVNNAPVTQTSIGGTTVSNNNRYSGGSAGGRSSYNIGGAQ